MGPPREFEHVSLVDTDHPDGIYRVVGTNEDAVTLLRVADDEGRRIHSGTLVTVSAAAFDDVDPAGNPDGNRPLGTAVLSAIEMGYWSVETFLVQLSGNPTATALGIGLLLGGGLGDQLFPVPDTVSGALILVGSLWIAYVGSGWYAR